MRQTGGTNEVDVQAGKGSQVYDWTGQEEYNLEEARGFGRRGRPESTIAESDIPAGRIRAKTEVVISISDRVDWRDDLF